MALKVGELYALLEAEDRGFTKALRDAQSSMERARSFSMGLLGAVGAMGAGLVAAATKGVILAGQMEQTQIAFKTLLGSAKEADAFVRQLWDFAATTPFEFEGLTQSARQLLAFGFEAKEVIPLVRAVGDAVSALGGGEFEIQRVIYALGQMRAKGKVSAEEMMQLAELGIPAWEMLANAIGTSIPEAMERASKGAIPAAVGINAIVEGMAKRFAGSMEEQSRTLLGRWSTFKDNLSGILRGIGQDIVRAFDLSEALGRVNEVLGKLSDVITQGGLRGLAQMVPPWLAGTIVGVAGAITGALLPALISLAKTAYMLARSAVIALGPWAAAGAAVALAAYLIYRNWDRVRPLWEQLRSAAEPALNAIRQIVADLAAYLATVWPDIQRNIQTFLAWIAPAFRVVFGVALQYVRNVIQGISTMLQGWANIISGIVKAIAAVLAGDWAGAWDAVKQIFRGAIQAITGLFQASFVGQILSLLTSLGARLLDWARSAMAGLAQRIAAGGQAVLDWFRALPGRVAEYLSTLPERMAYWAGRAIAATLQWFATLPGRVAQFVQSMYQQVLTWFTTTTTTATTQASMLTTNVLTWLASLPGKAAEALAALPGKVGALLNNAKTAAVNAARSLVDGVRDTIAQIPGIFSGIFERVWSEISSWPGRLAAKARSIAASFWEGFKDGLGIHSPSYIERAFMAIEDQAWSTMASLRRMVPAIRPLMAQVAQPVMPAVAAASRPSMASGPAPVQIGTVQVTVQARDLREVEDVLALFRNLRQAARAGV